MPRLFTGLELPEDVCDALLKLKQPLPGARWLAADKLHITLRFAGDLSKRQAEDLTNALGDIVANPIEISLTGLDVFGSGQPRSLFAGVKASPELMQLALAHERAARSIGLAPEKRKFRPHVTLARLNGTPPGLLARILQRKGLFLVAPFLATRFVLYSSRPHVGGGPYVIEASYPFAGVAELDEEDDYGTYRH